MKKKSGAKTSKRSTPHPRSLSPVRRGRTASNGRHQRRGGSASNGQTDLWAHGYGRAALERMMRIHRKIEDREYPNCRRMSGEFEVSVRTLKRDIEFMKNSLALPIEFDVPKNGYYFASPQPHFPRVPLTEAEVVGLFVAQKSIAQYQGTALQPVLESAFKKMTAQLDDSVRFSLGHLNEVMSIRPFGPGDAELEKFELLTRAIRERRAVRFHYRKRGQLRTVSKRVQPYHIAYVNNLWTLFASYPDGGPSRSGHHDQTGHRANTRQSKPVVQKFVLFRLTQPELAGEKFAVSKQFDLNKELEGSLGVFKGSEDYEVVVEFDAWGADDVRARLWHSSQELIEQPRGGLTVKMRLNSLEEIEKWILGFGEHASVIGPRELRERVGKTAKAIQKKY